MFRRKEENAADSSNDLVNSITLAVSKNETNGNNMSTANTPNNTSTTPANSANAAVVSQPNEAQNNTATQTATAATTTAPAPVNSAQRNPAEPQRAAGTVGYRAAPVTDFSRNITKTFQDSPQRVASVIAPIVQQAQPTILNNSSSSEKSDELVKRSPRILTVGNDILLKGEITNCDRVIIEGKVEAKLSDVHTLAIAGCGSFKGTAEVEHAEITGLFEGDLIVRNRLIIYTSGEVRGNITYGEIEIERGGKLTGQIKT
ncbi:MAG: polymer-forming cytoskeletal protein, partial [Pseudomonadota bacterium]